MSYNIDENGLIYYDLDNNIYASRGDWMELEFYDSPKGSSSSGYSSAGSPYDGSSESSPASARSPYDGSSESSPEPESEVSTTSTTTSSTTSSTTTSRKRGRGCRRKSDDEVENLDNTKRCRNSRKQRNEERDLDMKELDRVTKEYDDLKERVDNTEYWLNEARRLFMEMHEHESANITIKY